MAVKDEKLFIEDVFTLFNPSFTKNYLPLEIGYCNGNRHKSFTEACIEYTQMEDGKQVQYVALDKLLPAAFQKLKQDQPANQGSEKGMTIKQKPDTSADVYKQQQLAVKCLLDFLQDYKQHEESLIKIGFDRESSETSVSAVLAVHLFSKLIPNGEVIINKDMRGQTTECPCGCKAALKTGDTGVGNKLIWHGHPDLLVSQTAITVKKVPDTAEDDEENEESRPPDPKKIKVAPDILPEYNYSVEVETRDAEVNTRDCDFFDEEVFSQLTSQAITNGFAQKKKLGLIKQVIPSICCTVADIMILLYDPDNDILIRRLRSLKLIINNKLMRSAVVELWLVLNLHLFGPCLPESACEIMVKSGVKALFARKGVLKIYEDCLVGLNQRHFYVEQSSILDPDVIESVCKPAILDI